MFNSNTAAASQPRLGNEAGDLTSETRATPLVQQHGHLTCRSDNLPRRCSDGQEMTGTSDDHTINLWQVSDGDVLRTLSKHAGFVCCCHSADGEPSCPNLSVLNTCARAFPSNTDTAVPVPAIKEESQRQQK